MKKLLITVMFMSTVLAGCGAEREVAKVEPIVAEYIGETIETAIEEVVPDTEESTLTEVATEVAEEITEDAIATISVNTGCSVNIDDTYTEEEKVTDDFTYATKDPFDMNAFVTYEASFDKGDEEHYVSEGLNKWEYGCFYTAGAWHTDSERKVNFDDYDLSLYGGYANDAFAVAKWKEEWLEPTEEEANKLQLALIRLNAFQIINPSVVEAVDGIVYYEATIDSSYLNGFTVTEGTAVPCKVSFHKSTQELRGIHISIEDAMYNGEAIKNLKWNCMVNWGSGIEGTPIGYEEALGING